MSECKTVVVEFDGVLHGEPVYDVREVPGDGRWDPVPRGKCSPEGKALVERELAQGQKVVIYSERAHWMDGFRGIRDWLKRNGFPELQIASVLFPHCKYVSARCERFMQGSDS